MKKQVLSFFVLSCFVFVSLAPAASGQDETAVDFFSYDRFIKSFRFNLTADRPVLLIDDTGTKEAFKKIENDSTAGLITSREPENKAPQPAKKVKSKKLGRAILFNLGVWLIDSTRYWLEYAKWVEDWQFQLNWKDQSRRIFQFEGNKFDSNPFLTNWTHGLSGAIYYNFARYHRLNILESVLFEVASSFWWEYVTEWREVISVNDNFFSGIGGMPIGEPMFQIGRYLQDQKGIPRVLGMLLNPMMALSELFGGRKWRRSFDDPLYKPRFDFFLGGQTLDYTGDEDLDNKFFDVGIDIRLHTIPGFGEASENKINRYHNNTMFTRMAFRLSFSENGVEEYNFFTRAFIFGRFRQEIKKDAANRLRGHSLFFGAASAFDLFKKRAVAYYDIPEYHYDFAGGEQAEQPTEFSDKMAIINLIGPALDLTVYSGQAQFRLSLGAYLDFALINALSLNKYSLTNDIYNPRMKTTMVHYGYYYAFGFTLSGSAGVRYRNFELEGSLKYQYYDSIEGLDRFQDWLDDDCNLNDSRLVYKAAIGYILGRSPVKLFLACEGIERKGWLKEVTQQYSEFRFYWQLKLSF
ncbi:MAG: DUF3943 domain-containing protein [Candidatus Aminicenantes bacterium]|nr:DUF3943 domain-containing protein [Candidatus Aminicenantes bacterium]